MNTGGIIIIRTIGLMGLPASGKSTVMKHFIRELEQAGGRVTKERMGLLDYLKLEAVDGACYYVLGKYQKSKELFPGTDRLSMAVQPYAVSFVQEMSHMKASSGGFPVFILWEGDRLTNKKFLKACQQVSLCEWVYLEVEEQERRARLRVRGGSTQQETWVKGRRTKISNLQRDFKFTRVTLPKQSEEGKVNLIKQVADKMLGQ